MDDLDLITGLADIGEQLKTGNANHAALYAQLQELIKLMRRDQPVPQVNVQAIGPTPPAYTWHHRWTYDALGRIESGESIPILKA